MLARCLDPFSSRSARPGDTRGIFYARRVGDVYDARCDGRGKPVCDDARELVLLFRVSLRCLVEVVTVKDV